MKIVKNDLSEYVLDADIKRSLMGKWWARNLNTNAIRSKTINGLMLNLVGVYLEGDYLEGGRM